MKAYVQKRNAGDIFDAFDELFRPMFYDEKFDSMRTDIKETDEGYELAIEMPGYEKEDIKVSLENGYLTIGAERQKKEEGEKQNVRYIRKECSVSCQRSYYVGDDIEKENVKAKYENGVLMLFIPKTAPRKDDAKTIAIE